MRLPTRDGKCFGPGIVQDQAIRMIRHAADQGVNYFDTAYVYHDGVSETVLGKALRDGYRNRVKIATKSPLWIVRNPEDFDKYLNESLRRLGADHIDYYLLHALDRNNWKQKVLGLGLLDRAEAAVRDGRIGHIGFSFHDEAEVFTEILNGYDRWDFCQIQYNYMDVANQAGAAGLKLAASKGVAVVVMEPLLGGRLARPPAAVHGLFSGVDRGRSPADWALQWLWDQPEVTTVLSGMSAPEQVDENLESARRSAVGSFTSEDHELISRVRAAYRGRTAVDCTKCNYCMPCPSGVNIPTVFEVYNDAFLHDDAPGARFFYQMFVPAAAQAAACSACRECEEKCPQQIRVSEWMPRIHAYLSAPA
jgi:predicted aldo/keto reductase-like oxidoreductase